MLCSLDPCSTPVVPSAGSPLIDAGDPGESDRAGGRSAIGAVDGHREGCGSTDGDGVSLDTNCNEYDVETYPGAPEIPYDALDQDCDGADWLDVDGDGVDYPNDCDGADPASAPGTTEIPYSDPAGPFHPRGCQSAPTGAPSLMLLFLARGRR